MAFISPSISPAQSSHHTNVTRPSKCGRRPQPQPLHFPRVVACSSEQGRVKIDKGKNSDVSGAREARVALWREVESLKKSLTIAVNAQRFADAARLRDQIESLSLADDYVRTEKELEKAVREERFADAARLRDVLKVLEPPPGIALLRGETEANSALEETPMTDMKADDVESWSKTKTAGIVVHVESYYMPEQSLPEQSRFLFGYKVTITNEGDETCQLVSRHWKINSTGGPESEVKGPGVVGRQPVLEPGETFEYTSACPVTVPLKGGQSVVGNMRGKYHFCKGDTGNVKFSVDIAPFYLKLPFRNYRATSGPPPPGIKS